MDVGIVIPAYNEGAALANVLSNVLNHIPQMRVYVIDDGSSDNTSSVAGQYDVNLIVHEENRGKGEALKSGFSRAAADGCDYLITLDGDGQHDPEIIPEFLRMAEAEEADIVIGCRDFNPKIMPWDRIFSNRVSSGIVSLLAGCRIPDSQCGFRMVRSDVIDNVELNTKNYELETELLIKAMRRGFTVAFCEIPVIYSGDETSNIRRFQDTYRFCRLCLRLLFTRYK